MPTEKPEKEKKKKAEKQDFKKLAEENLRGWQRAKADYQNLVKRSAEEKIEVVTRANEQLILEILPLLDNLGHAVDHLPKELKGNSWVEGVTFIRIQLENILSDQNVAAMKSVGEKFDPNKHEAVEQVKGDKKKSGEIIKEVQTGYMMGEKAIRVAKVKVIK